MKYKKGFTLSVIGVGLNIPLPSRLKREGGGVAGSKLGKMFKLCIILTLTVAVIENSYHSTLNFFRGGLTRHFRVTEGDNQCDKQVLDPAPPKSDKNGFYI